MWSMRLGTLLAWGLLALPAPAQPFGFTHQMFPARADEARAVSLGDVDGDGDLDAFVGNAGCAAGQSRLHLNDGAGVFTEVTAGNLPALLDFTNDIALGDVDGDGDLDAFLGNFGQNRLYLNGGAGVFMDATATNLPVGSGTTRDVELGDVDGDGDLDAFLARMIFGPALPQSLLYLNNGAGVFADATAASLPPPPFGASAVAMGDVDGDGDLDAFLADNGMQETRLYRNGGTGIYTDATSGNFPLGLGANSVEMGDVDGDGDLDLLLGNLDQQIRLYLNDGAGGFANVTATNLPALVDWTETLALGDVDGDGDLDALVGIVGQSRLLLNGGAGTFVDATAATLPALFVATTAVALGDVDGDGDLDAVFGDTSLPAGAQNRLLLNDGGAVFSDGTGPDLPSVVDATLAVALGDVDGDGDVDAFLGNDVSPYTPDQIRLLLNAGAGFFAEVTATNLPALAGSIPAVALADVDADGDLDAFLATPSQDRLLLNGGGGLFTDVTATNLPALADFTLAVALGDVDGDGDLDAVLGNMAQDRLLLNGGAGAFAIAPPGNLPAVGDQTHAVALGDLDGDGDLDVVVGNAGTPSAGQDRIYRNGGAGVFTDVTSGSLPSLIDETASVALGDVDGDGDLDVFVGNTAGAGNPSGGQNRLLRNGGGGVFTDATAGNLPVLLGNTVAVSLGDLDGDGDLDAFLANFWQQSRLYVNDGSGDFADGTASALPSLVDFSRAVSLADLDGDGDLDAFAGVTGRDRVYTNLSRQLSWRGIPRAGKPLALDIAGPPGGAWLLAASGATASIPFPPFGTLRLLPATTFVAAGGALDPQGRGSVSLLVPASPALVGVTLYWQAVAGPPFLLTNLEVTTVTTM